MRAVQNFPISGQTLTRHPALLRALAMVKHAAALTNSQLGKLPDTKRDAIIAAAREIIKRRGQSGVDQETATRSAYVIPYLLQKLGRVRRRGLQHERGRHAGLDHVLEFLRVLAMRIDRGVGAKSHFDAGVCHP